MEFSEDKGMVVAISNGFIRMASGSIFFPQVFMQFPVIFGHSYVLLKHKGHTIQPVSMRLDSCTMV